MNRQHRALGNGAVDAEGRCRLTASARVFVCAQSRGEGKQCQFVRYTLPGTDQTLGRQVVRLAA